MWGGMSSMWRSSTYSRINLWYCNLKSGHADNLLSTCLSLLKALSRDEPRVLILSLNGSLTIYLPSESREWLFAKWDSVPCSSLVKYFLAGSSSISQNLLKTASTSQWWTFTLRCEDVLTRPDRTHPKMEFWATGVNFEPSHLPSLIIRAVTSAPNKMSTSPGWW